MTSRARSQLSLNSAFVIDDLPPLLTFLPHGIYAKIFANRFGAALTFKCRNAAVQRFLSVPDRYAMLFPTHIKTIKFLDLIYLFM